MKTLKQSILENLGTLLFKDMPSADKENYRRIKIKYSEYRKLYTDKVKKIIEDDGFIFGENNNHIIIAIAVKGTWKTLDYNEYNKIITPYEKKFQELINKLDKETDIYFEASYAGNSGWDANKIIYSNIATTYGKKKIEYELKYDFSDLNPIKSYVYSSMKKYGSDDTTIIYYDRNDINCYKKSSEKSTDIKYDDIKDEILEYANQVAKSINKEYNISISKGKRQSDNNSDNYEAFVVNKSKAQYGHFVIEQNKFGDASISVRIPLVGESTYDLDFNKWKEDIEKVIKRICK